MKPSHSVTHLTATSFHLSTNNPHNDYRKVSKYKLLVGLLKGTTRIKIFTPVFLRNFKSRIEMHIKTLITNKRTKRVLSSISQNHSTRQNTVFMQRYVHFQRNTVFFHS
jgi:hypothetical protein